LGGRGLQAALVKKLKKKRLDNTLSSPGRRRQKKEIQWKTKKDVRQQTKGDRLD